MNWKGIVIGGLVATISPFVLAIGLIITGLNNGVFMLITFFVPMFIGASIAGKMSIDKSNSWKNGACAIALMEILFVFMMYLANYYLIHDPLAIITVTPFFLLIGAIGGFIGGKMKS